jgi:hypothetical protein
MAAIAIPAGTVDDGPFGVSKRACTLVDPRHRGSQRRRAAGGR